jgi:hypothetical protein
MGDTRSPSRRDDPSKRLTAAAGFLETAMTNSASRGAETEHASAHAAIDQHLRPPVALIGLDTI